MADMSSVQLSRRRFRVFSWSGAAIVAAIFLTLNYIVSFVPLRLDTSSGRAYSISRGSKNILKKLDDTLIVKVLFSSQLPAVYKLNQDYLLDLLTEYKRASNGRIRIEYLDPSLSPLAKEEAISNGVSPVQVDVRERDRREVKECFMGVAFIYGTKREAIPILQDTANLEYEISVRIKRLVDPAKTKVGIVTNGGGLTMSSKSLETVAGPLKDLYDVQEVDLSKPVPEGIKALWSIAPNEGWDEVAFASADQFLNSGGTLGLLINRYDVSVEQFRTKPLVPNFQKLLSGWGLNQRSGLVVDPRADRIQIQTVQGAFRMVNIVDYPYIPWSTDLDRQHPATKNLDGVSFPFVSAIEVTNPPPAGVVFTSLAKSSPYSFIDQDPMDMSPLRQHEPMPNDPRGPFDLGVVAQRGNARLIVFGTSRFIQTEFPSRPTNYSLFVNLLDWSVQDEALIQVRSRGFARRPLRQMNDTQRVLAKYAMVLFLPVMALVLGVVVWRRQKIRRALLPLKFQEA